MQFCLLMPLICRVFMIANPWLRRGLMVLTILIPPFYKVGVNQAWLPAQVDYFMTGLLLADCHLTSWSKAGGRLAALWTWLGPCAFVGMIGLLAIRHDHQLIADGFMPWVVFAGIGATLHSPVWKGLFAHPLPATIGGWCYTLYLYHLLIFSGMITLLFKVWPLKGLHAAFWCYLPFCIAAVLVSCGVLYVLTERPFIELASRLAKKRPGVPVAETAAS